jgi:hypothetical protein
LVIKTIKMKEQTLIEMKNKIDALIRVVQGIMDEQRNLTTLAAGTFETLKLMPDYEEAVAKLVERAKEKEGGSNVE